MTQVWRVNALGQLGSALMLPLIGAFVLVGTALLLQEHRVLRAFNIVAGTMVVLLSGALVMFARDTMQLPGAPRVAAAAPAPSYPFTFEQVLLAYSATILVSVWLCVGTYRVWRRAAAVVRRERESVLIVREATGRHGNPGTSGGSPAEA
jgi:hypothetical protein